MNRYIVFPFVSSLALFISAAAYSSSDEETLVIEEIVVSAAFEKSQEDLALPISVVKDDELRNKAAASLGEALSEEIGISLSSYGTSVGHPVIRGQTGNRVSVLQNGATVADVANQSPDHVEAVEPLTADRVEVLRGPSTLLYGGGAVAGVINVIDGRIPEEVPEKPRLMIQQSNNSVNSGDNTDTDMTVNSKVCDLTSDDKIKKRNKIANKHREKRENSCKYKVYKYRH